MTKEPLPKVHTADELKSVIYDMDYLSQCGFDEISSVAKLALIALESPNAYQNPEHIAKAFIVILGRAGDFMNAINCEAENVGSNYRDKRERARADAWSAYNDERKTENTRCEAESAKEEVQS